MKRDFCSCFDSGYRMYGLTLFRSLQKVCREFRLFVFCLDDLAFELLENLDERLIPIPLSDLEKEDPELAACRNDRRKVEYYFTLSPNYPLYLFRKYPNLETVTYLDSDLLFFSSPESLCQELGEKSMLIFEHDFSFEPEKMASLYGRFNMSFQIYRRTPLSIRCLEWWRKSCIEWCHDYPENGKYADQKYMDHFPELLKDELVISRNPGASVAPWNIAKRHFELREGQCYFNGAKLIFCHYQGYKFLNEIFVTWPLWQRQKFPGKSLEFLAETYYREVMETFKAFPSCFGKKIDFPPFRTSRLVWMEKLFARLPSEKLRILCRLFCMMLRPGCNVMRRGKPLV